MEIICTGLSLNELTEKIREVVAMEIRSALGDQEPKETADEYLTRKETAEMLGVSLPTLHSYVNKGYIKAHRLGEKTIRFKKEDVLYAINAVEPMRYRRA